MIKRIVHHRYGGEAAVTLSFAQYRAMLVPEIGANLISFRDVERGLHFLRTPPAHDMQQFKQSAPCVNGIPVLFPPNRYEDGTFTFQHHRYQFPINEAKTHTHLHGLLHSVPWRVVGTGTLPEQVYVDVAQNVDANHPAYRYFPHPFTFVIRYALSMEGLQQSVYVQNTGPHAMPFMLGFHTTLNVPFASGGDGADYSFTATIGKRWELNDRQLPTGLHQTLSTREHQLQNDGIPRSSERWTTITPRRKKTGEIT